MDRPGVIEAFQDEITAIENTIAYLHVRILRKRIAIEEVRLGLGEMPECKRQNRNGKLDGRTKAGREIKRRLQAELSGHPS
jgi:hypothetical protein